jgi:hypothetical protein
MVGGTWVSGGLLDAIGAKVDATTGSTTPDLKVMPPGAYRPFDVPHTHINVH